MTSPSTAAPDTRSFGTAETATPAAARHGAEYEGALTVLSRQTVADGVVSLELAPDSGEPLPRWQAGAHIDVVLPTGVTRQYSLCGPAGNAARWRIAVLREPDGRGGSQWMHDNVREGTRLRVRGPSNNFAERLAKRLHLDAFVGDDGDAAIDLLPAAPG